jgi:hypothetical protein
MCSICIDERRLRGCNGIIMRGCSGRATSQRPRRPRPRRTREVCLLWQMAGNRVRAVRTLDACGKSVTISQLNPHWVTRHEKGHRLMRNVHRPNPGMIRKGAASTRVPSCLHPLADYPSELLQWRDTATVPCDCRSAWTARIVARLESRSDVPGIAV